MEKLTISFFNVVFVFLWQAIKYFGNFLWLSNKVVGNNIYKTK